jgi:importin subunit alpha-1
VWALGNIAGDCIQTRDTVLHNGGLQQLLALFQMGNMKASMARNAVWAISNMCRGKPQPKWELVAPAMNVLAYLLNVHQSDDDILIDTCWGLSYLSDDNTKDNSRIQTVVASGVVPRLILMLGHSNEKIVTPALRAIGNIATGDEHQTEELTRNDACRQLLPLLSHSRKNIRKEVCWTISNITAGSVTQIQSVIDANIIPGLIEVLKRDEFDVKKEAVWAISNATSGGDPHQIDFFVGQGMLPPIVELLECNDTKVVLVCLEAVENVLKNGLLRSQQTCRENQCCEFLEKCGGLDALERLSESPNTDIYERSLKILTTYFEEETDDDPSQQTMSSGQFSFDGGNSSNNNSSSSSGGFRF